MDNKNKFAILTGASQGFGKALAYEVVKRKYNIILVSLPNEGLEKFAIELRTYGVDVRFYEVDLTIKEELLEFTKWVNDNFDINILINNAGIGSAIKMVDSHLDHIETLINLNITATALIVHQLLPNMLRQDEKTYILNVSSMAAYFPIPYKTIYPASKSFVHNFSRGLRQELRDTNVFVSVVHPGPMRTNDIMLNRLKNLGFFGQLGILTPEKAAKLTIKKLFRNDSSILLGWGNNFLWFLMSLLPVRLKMRMVSNSFKKQI